MNGLSMYDAVASQPKIRYANFLDIPFVLDGFESGAYEGVFADDFINWIYRLNWLCRLFPVIFKDMLRPNIHRVGPHLQVADFNGGTIAFVFTYTEQIELGCIPTCSILCIFVDPAYRKRGLGKELLEHVIDAHPKPCAFVCECMPNAKSMMSILGRLGFKIKKVAKLLRKNNPRPYRLEKINK